MTSNKKFPEERQAEKIICVSPPKAGKHKIESQQLTGVIIYENIKTKIQENVLVFTAFAGVYYFVRFLLYAFCFRAAADVQH